MERRRPSEKREGPIGRGERTEGARPAWQERVKRDRDVEKSPLIPSEITPEDIDMGVRVQLKTLTAENAEMVARHLAMVNLLIESDPELAHKHALAASRRAGRLAIVHETLGVTAYTVGDYSLALRELLTHRRLSGSNEQLPLIVDSERGMGRPARALEAVTGLDRKKLPVGVRINLAVALSGARLDLGDAKNAKLELEIPELTPKQVFPQSPLLFRAYAEVLRELGQDGDSWDELADRAEIALSQVDGEMFELIEEITIPTSADFERKPAKRDFDSAKRDGKTFERRPRPAGGDDRKPRGERGSEYKPRGERSSDFKPRGERASEYKPRGERSSDYKPRTPRPEGSDGKPAPKRDFDSRGRDGKPRGGASFGKGAPRPGRRGPSEGGGRGKAR
ncbi:MAG: hypothetical protein RL450_672 [Actinomycetota bacterium]